MPIPRGLDAAAAHYRELGFAIGACNRHSWGTHHHIASFPGFFVELLTRGEPDKLVGDIVSEKFGLYNRGFAPRPPGP